MWKIKSDHNKGILKYGVILESVFFYFNEEFCGFMKFEGKTSIPFTIQITRFYNKFSYYDFDLLDKYFQNFQIEMWKRERIPFHLVEEYKNEWCFLVNTRNVWFRQFNLEPSGLLCFSMK